MIIKSVATDDKFCGFLTYVPGKDKSKKRLQKSPFPITCHLVTLYTVHVMKTVLLN